MPLTGSGLLDAEQAFTRMARARKRAALARWLRRESVGEGQLRVYDERVLRTMSAQPVPGIREIPVEAIRGTLEPSRARLFDCSFRPAASARQRWQRLWLAEHRGAVLPPISVVKAGDSYAIRDGHHRVSVAKARGASTIDASVDVARLG
jgi:ParB-like nuclease domain